MPLEQQEVVVLVLLVLLEALLRFSHLKHWGQEPLLQVRVPGLRWEEILPQIR
jgi:hypothetical protein